MYEQETTKTPLAWVKRHPLLMWFSGVFFIPLLIAVGLTFNHLQTTLPALSGEVQLDGINRPVELRRDAHGALTVQAETDYDAFFAMGYAHAQDRLWQLTLIKHMVRGRLSEVLGQEALGFDSYVRTLGIFASAEASLGALDAESITSLHAYASGINSWLKQGHSLPLEFTLTGIKPELWTAQDSIAWLKLFALNMAENYQQELSRLLLTQVLPTPALQELVEQPASGPVTIENTVASDIARHSASAGTKQPLTESDVNHLTGLMTLGQSLKEQYLFDAQNIGSNAWAVRSDSADTQSVLLANDPHLGLEIPSIWYAADIHGGKLNVAGMNLIGVPIVLLGKNEHIAWGATNMLADTQDLFHLRTNPQNPEQYWLDGAWQDFTVKEYQLKVKAPFPAVLREPLAPVALQIRQTVFGPVISDLIGSVEQPMALSWVGSSTSDTSYQAFFDLNYAADWEQFRTAMAQHVAPAMNLVYADTAQNIGYLGVGQIPVRSSGNGSVPLPGMHTANAWQTFIPQTQMPMSFNPQSGYIVSANNRVADDSYPYFISNNFAEPARAERIIKRLLALPEGALLDIAQHQSIQLEQQDGQVMALVELLSNLPAPEGSTQPLHQALAQWDGNTSVDSVGSTVFFVLLRHLRQELFADDLAVAWGRDALDRTLQNILSEFSVTQVHSGFLPGAVDWCDYQSTDKVESCTAVLHKALEKTEKDLSRLLSDSVEDWQWGDAHTMLLAHRPFSDIRGLDFMFERTVKSGGSPNSINVSAFTWDQNEGFQQQYGAGFRQIMVLGESPAHLYVNSTGQSGNLFSRHYDDMVDAFVSGQYYSLLSPQSAEINVLRLQPASLTR